MIVASAGDGRKQRNRKTGATDMLVLSRKVGERILIGDNIAVTIVRISQGVVRVGIEAPPETPIVREELKHSVRDRQAPAAAEAKPDVVP